MSRDHQSPALSQADSQPHGETNESLDFRRRLPPRSKFPMVLFSSRLTLLGGEQKISG